MRGADPILDFILRDEGGLLARPGRVHDGLRGDGAKFRRRVVMPRNFGLFTSARGPRWGNQRPPRRGNQPRDVISHKRKNSYVYAESAP